MTYLSTKVKHLFVSFLLVLTLFTIVDIDTPTAFAQDFPSVEEIAAANNKFIPLVGIPYVDTSQPMSLPTYINALYLASISIAAFLAVVKIIFAGVKYMLSDVVTTKADAKKDIRGALIGLLIVIGAVLILNTINPNLSGLDALNGPGVAIRLGSYESKAPKEKSNDTYKSCGNATYEECEVSICKPLNGTMEKRGSRFGCLLTTKDVAGTVTPVADLTFNENIRYKTTEFNELLKIVQENDDGSILHYTDPSFNTNKSDINIARKTCSDGKRGAPGTPYTVQGQGSNAVGGQNVFVVCVAS